MYDVIRDTADNGDQEAHAIHNTAEVSRKPLVELQGAAQTKVITKFLLTYDLSSTLVVRSFSSNQITLLFSMRSHFGQR